MSVTVRHWAAARAAAGVGEEQVDGVGTLADLTALLGSRHGRGYATVLARCSFLVDEVSPGRVAPDGVVVRDGAVVDVLPPFAGGSGTAPAGSELRCL